jgi:hypothetical protein
LNNTMSNLILSTGLALCPVALGGVLWTETGDAGELPGTAQAVLTSPADALDAITGELADLGGVDDIDLFRIQIVDPDGFSVTFAGSLSEDNDAHMFLFDEQGSLVLYNDDGSSGVEPEFGLGDLAGGDPGIYLLGIALFETLPANDPLTAWDRAPFPLQFGNYRLSFTGAATVPEPAEWGALAALGLFGWTLLRRRPGS